MTKGMWMVVGACALGACAGPVEETRVARRAQMTQPETESSGADEAAVTPEQMEEIEGLFRRKEPQVVSCYNEELARAPREQKIEGDVTFNMVVEQTGHATGVRVVKTSLNNPTIETCVAKMIATWKFPTVSGRYAVSHRYGFKRAY